MRRQHARCYYRTCIHCRLVILPKSCFPLAALLSLLLTAAFLQWWQVPSYPRELWIILGLSTLLFIGVGLITHSGLSFLFLCITLGASAGFFRVAQTTHVTDQTSV